MSIKKSGTLATTMLVGLAGSGAILTFVGWYYAAATLLLMAIAFYFGLGTD